MAPWVIVAKKRIRNRSSAECSAGLTLEGSLGNSSVRGSHHTGWPFGRGDPDDDVGDNIRTRDQGCESPEDSNQSRVHIKIVGYAGTDTGDFSVVCRAHKFLRRDIARRHCRCGSLRLFCSAAIAKLGTGRDVFLAAYASHWVTPTGLNCLASLAIST